MRKTSLLLINGLFSMLLLLASCSGKEMPVEEETKSPASEEVEKEEVADTVWLKDIVYTYSYPSEFSWDTTIRIDGDEFTLLMKSELLDNQYKALRIYEQDGKTQAQRYVGPNNKYSFILYDSLDNKVNENSWDKYQLEQYVSMDLLAGSRGDYWNYHGFHNEFNSFFINVYWMFEDSDVGEVYKLFLDKDLNIVDYIQDSFTGGGGCHCEEEPSEDGKTFAFCTQIYRSNGKHNKLQKNDTKVAGSFILNNKYSLVVELYEGKPPYRNAKIIDRNGRVVKKFDYLGISGALGYTIPKFQVKDQNALFLLDDQQRSLFRIDLENPLFIERIDIDKLERMQEGEVLNERMPEYLMISSEVKTFYFEYRNKEFRYYSESPDF